MSRGPSAHGSWHYRAAQCSTGARALRYLSDALIELVDEGHPVVAGTADLQYSNGLVRFAKRASRPLHPVRHLRAEHGHRGGRARHHRPASLMWRPSRRSSRCSAASRSAWTSPTPALPVRLIGHHAGIALGFYGTSHHATEDLAIMRSIADLTVVAPADGPQLAAAIRATVDCIRSRSTSASGAARNPTSTPTTSSSSSARRSCIAKASDLTLIASGIDACIRRSQAADALRAQGRSVGLIDMHTIKPLDRDAILAAARRTRVLMTVEEHNVLGGLGGAVAEVLADAGCRRALRAPRHRRRIQPDRAADPSLSPLPARRRRHRGGRAGGAGMSRQFLSENPRAGAEQVLPGGHMSPSRKLGLPYVFVRAEAPTCSTPMASEHIDFHCGFGANVLGHCHPAIRQRVAQVGEAP